jgi:hypothetical protein
MVNVAITLYPVAESKIGLLVWSTLLRGRAYAGCDASEGAESGIRSAAEVDPRARVLGKVNTN